MIIFNARGRAACCELTGPITTGSVGISVRFFFDAAWDGLEKIAVFSGSGTAADVALLGDTCTVPAQVLATAGGTLRIGVYGQNTAGTVVIPTVWANAGAIVRGTAPSGVDPAEPAPSWSAQVQAAAASALEKATAVETAAARGDFDGENGKSAYQTAVEGGYTGTAEEFAEKLAAPVPTEVFWATYGTTDAETIYKEMSTSKLVLCAYNDLVYTAYRKSVDDGSSIVRYQAFFKTANAENSLTATTYHNYQNGRKSTSWAPSNLALAPLASPTFIGTPKAPTAAAGTDTTQIATTAFANAAAAAAVAPVEALIPDGASSENQLADTAAVYAAIAEALSGITGISFEVVQSLPASGEAGTIYLVPHGGSEAANIYDEYVWISSSRWELLGTTAVDLTGYATEAWVQQQGYGTYSKPSGGIPSSDMAAVVQSSLGKADTALQAVPDTYRTAAAQDVIDGAQDTTIAGKYTKPSGGIPVSDLAQAVQTSLGKADTALQSVPSAYRTAAAQGVIDAAQDAAIAGKEPRGLGISAAQVGQLVTVEAVDADGKPTRWTASSLAVYPAVLAITTPPNRTSYYVWQSFDPTGLTAQITYSDGATETVDAALLTYSPAVFDTDGTQLVTVAWRRDSYTLTAIQPVRVTDFDAPYRERVASATSKAQVDAIFAEWWSAVQQQTGESDKVALLNRWFGDVLTDERVHGAKLPLFATSTSTFGVLIDDSAGLVCEPSTATVAGRDDFAHLPQFWILEVSAEKTADGSLEVYKIQHIDPISEVRSGEHLCQVLQKNTYWREWQEDGYHYYRQQCAPFDGAELWQPTNADGYAYQFVARPKYMAGWTDSARTAVTCGTGLMPTTNMSHQTGVLKWRARNAKYAGGSYRVAKWQLVMFALKYAAKGNSGIIEGCSTYIFEYTVSASETDATRVILTTAQAANLIVGSAISVTARGATSVRITSIEPVEIDGTTYAAVNLDTAPISPVAGTTKLSTMPYWSGHNDTVLGNDGSRTNAINGKEPGLIQGTEFGIGAYEIVADEFLRWAQSGSDYALDIYICNDQSKVSATAITSDYQRVAGGTLTNLTNGWQYIRDMHPCPTNWPQALSGDAGSVNGCRAALGVNRGSGVRASWAFAYLFHGGYCGLPARVSSNAPGGAYWYGALGSPSTTG